MERCLQLAKNGLGQTYPNPLVGCVIVHEGKIIGEGWHQKAGTGHAEVNAINSVKQPELLKNATLYVNLEPCSHYGKTPPCSQLIIKKGIPRVVVGITDPNPKVAGRGIQQLREAEIEVKVGCLSNKCTELNRRFLTAQIKKRPYIILKWAKTADGFIAPTTQKTGRAFWITNTYSKQIVHKWRSEEQAILVGKNTAIKDNPQLNTRLWKGNNPVRIAIDRDLEILKSSKHFLLDQTVKTVIFCKASNTDKDNLLFKVIDFTKPVVPQVLTALYHLNLKSLIVEGGAYTLQQFIGADLWDEARVFTGAPHLQSGIKAPTFNALPYREIKIQNDILKLYKHD